MSYEFRVPLQSNTNSSIPRPSQQIFPRFRHALTCRVVVTGEVQLALEQLQPDDGIDDDDKYHK